MNAWAVVQWILANKGMLMGAILTIIGTASLFIKALETLVAGLVTVFPSLQTADGDLKHVAGWLDGLSKASWLNLLAASPAQPEAPAPAAKPAV